MANVPLRSCMARQFARSASRVASQHRPGAEIRFIINELWQIPLTRFSQVQKLGFIGRILARSNGACHADASIVVERGARLARRRRGFRRAPISFCISVCARRWPTARAISELRAMFAKAHVVGCSTGGQIRNDDVRRRDRRGRAALRRDPAPPRLRGGADAGAFARLRRSDRPRARGRRSRRHLRSVRRPQRQRQRAGRRHHRRGRRRRCR